jgi:DNA-directed RNA polymerase subunit M|tara:strand:+ start:10006 stop:10332 length:327 start_codon:yes stop_codon:yes gene_type:complete
MQFCPKCKAMMAPKEIKGTDDVEMVCPSCGFKEGAEEELNSTVQEQEKPDDVAVIDEKNVSLPTAENECPKCGNKKAYWWIEQTRSADEAPTRFYRCTKCRHTWREYG